ncbi:hypothetical protein EST38_g11552 [Candolleomyces aberdarensis]|uniref:FCP1 homology domain-containing protein n=1 Tax=Candolleomyces aberdarensis TaxID=2316362 RepID=A0A4Q2D4L0_9AGAR|nr:hypothetical protein EST38_g11552 [Candolleomyces aberdarensis]
MPSSTSQDNPGHVNDETPSHEVSAEASKPQAQASSAASAEGGPEKEPSTRVPHKEEQNNLHEPERSEDASMSPTLTANKSPSTAHENPPKANGVKPGSPRPPKPSFLSRVVRVLLPCIAPSRAHNIDVDVYPSSSSQSSPTTQQQEKQAVTQLVDEEQPQVAQASASSPAHQPEPEKKTEEDQAPPTEKTEPEPQEEAVVRPTTPTLRPTAETEGLMAGAVQAPGSTGLPPTPERPHHGVDGNESEGTSFTEDDDLDDVHLDDDEEEDKLIRNGGAGIPIGPDGVPRPLLPPIAPIHAGRKCLVLDLDETLVHSSFKSISQADYVVPVEIEYHWHNVYVIKRPGVDNFLKKMGEIYEIVVFTASLSKYADPVLDKLDIHQVVSHRLFRESCYNHKGNYVKDLSQLGRPISDTIILDNSPASYIFHPNNAVPVSSWFNDPHDTELTDLVPFLTDLATVDDVRGILDGAR